LRWGTVATQDKQQDKQDPLHASIVQHTNETAMVKPSCIHLLTDSLLLHGVADAQQPLVSALNDELVRSPVATGDDDLVGNHPERAPELHPGDVRQRNREIPALNHESVRTKVKARRGEGERSTHGFDAAPKVRCPRAKNGFPEKLGPTASDDAQSVHVGSVTPTRSGGRPRRSIREGIGPVAPARRCRSDPRHRCEGSPPHHKSAWRRSRGAGRRSRGARRCCKRPRRVGIATQV